MSTKTDSDRRSLRLSAKQGWFLRVEVSPCRMPSGERLSGVEVEHLYRQLGEACR